MKDTLTLTQAVAKRTKELLRQNHKTQYRLVKDTCLDKTTIQSIFKEKTKDIKLSTVLLIAHFFNMSLSQFLDGYDFEFANIEI